MLREEEGRWESSLVPLAASWANLPLCQDLPSRQQVAWQRSPHGSRELLVRDLAPLLGPIEEVPGLVLIG